MFMAGRRCWGRSSLMVPQLRHVPGAGLGVQFFEHLVRPLMFVQCSDAARGIVEIAEDDRLCRTGMRARGGKAAIGNRDSFGPRRWVSLDPLVLGVDPR